MRSRIYPPDQDNSTLAIISLVAGVAGWTLVPFFAAFIAVITGHLAYREIRESNDAIGGKKLATAGLALGYGCLGIGIIGGCVILIGLVFGFDLLTSVDLLQ